MEEDKVSKRININCREASMLCIQKEHGSITWWQKIQLWLHSKLCSCAICQSFGKQSKAVSEIIKKAFTPDKETHKIEDSKKQKMQEELDDLFV